jgi:hypothetical protein
VRVSCKSSSDHCTPVFKACPRWRQDALHPTPHADLGLHPVELAAVAAGSSELCSALPANTYQPRFAANNEMALHMTSKTLAGVT